MVVKQMLYMLGHLYYCRQKSRKVCHNVQLMLMLSVKLTKIYQREYGKFVDFNDPTPI